MCFITILRPPTHTLDNKQEFFKRTFDSCSMAVLHLIKKYVTIPCEIEKLALERANV